MYYINGVSETNAIFDLGNVKYQGLSSFASAYGETGTYKNPNFVDIANNDYHLTSTSPAINTGVSGNDTIYDLDKKKRVNKTIDLGCYEIQ